MLGKIEGRKSRGQQKMKWMDGITDSMDMSFSKLGDSEWQGSLANLQSMESERVGHDVQTKQQQHLLEYKLHESKDLVLWLHDMK